MSQSSSGSDAPRGWAYRIRFGKPGTPADVDRTMLWALVVLLTGFGLVMVLSSSSVESFAAGSGVSSKFLRQAVFAVLGFSIMYVASRLPRQFWTGKIAGALLVVTLVLQALVFTPLGITEGGNRAWLDLGFTSLQPAEVGKIAMCVWFGAVLRMKGKPIERWQHLIVPILLPSLLIIGLAMAGKDLGTVMVMAVVLLGTMWFSGMPLRWIASGVALAVIGAVMAAALSPNRVARITAFFSGECDYEYLCWQTTHGFYALAHGGLFGVGLGNSTAKWSWLPEADNDYIFAIIGEEFGLLGALLVIVMFTALAIVMLRMWRNAADAPDRAIIGGVFSWIIFQAFVNIAVVIGLLPVLGVPLPFVSSGGSALVTTLLAMGIVLSVSRGTGPSVPSSAGNQPAGAVQARKESVSR
ncbi:putative lipid II flippase FtsW [uncultured Gulosibacter sp.]|uniref:putative lipid II flippase FtsW n=1 Tax=uncultured Gulosibacter sp. TaxID=1339167 RepID=UPI00288BE1B4|nr:putative lipid II flippase FtsW [uncultured Gulosibacter sp.]